MPDEGFTGYYLVNDNLCSQCEDEKTDTNDLRNVRFF